MAGPMGSPEHWREYAGAAQPAHLALLGLIIPRQPALTPQACPHGWCPCLGFQE